MTAQLFETHLPDPDATTTFAGQIAACLEPGDTLLLTGDIGAGKTHFARALIQSLQDNPEDVPSPTFTLIQSYETAKGEVLHADLYRLTGPDEIVELGLLDAFGTLICLIEWPDRLGPDTPAGALSLSFTVGRDGGQRVVSVCGDDAKWQDRLRTVG